MPHISKTVTASIESWYADSENVKERVHDTCTSIILESFSRLILMHSEHRASHRHPSSSCSSLSYVIYFHVSRNRLLTLYIRKFQASPWLTCRAYDSKWRHQHHPIISSFRRTKNYSKTTPYPYPVRRSECLLAKYISKVPWRYFRLSDVYLACIVCMGRGFRDSLRSYMFSRELSLLRI